jgi:hypothetical protein
MRGNENLKRKLKPGEYIKHQGNSWLMYVCAGMAETAKNKEGGHDGMQLNKE